MAFFKSHATDASPGEVFTAHPEIYRRWSELSEDMMNGPSPLTPGERELIAAYVVGLAQCEFAFVAHAAVAYAWGFPEGLLDELLSDLQTADIKPRLRALLTFVRKLTLTPTAMEQADADAVFECGWTEKALHDAIAVTARMCFMQGLVEGHGFTPMSASVARQRAEERVRKGYVNLYPAFEKND